MTTDDVAKIIIQALAERCRNLEHEREFFEQKWRETGELANAEREARQKAEAENAGLALQVAMLLPGAGEGKTHHDLDHEATDRAARAVAIQMVREEKAIFQYASAMLIDHIEYFKEAWAREAESGRETQP